MIQSRPSLAGYAAQKAMTSTDVQPFGWTIKSGERFTLDFYKIINGWVVSINNNSYYFESMEKALTDLPKVLIETKLEKE